MDNGSLQSVGIGGVLAIVILREVFAFLGKRRANGHEAAALDAMVEKRLQPLTLAIGDCRKEVVDTRHMVGNALTGITLAVQILVDREKGRR